MAITNGLKVFGRPEDVTTYTDSGVNVVGFQSGNTIFAQSINTALRDASLLPYTFIEILKSDVSTSALDLTITTQSEVSDIKPTLTSALNNYITRNNNIVLKNASNVDIATISYSNGTKTLTLKDPLKLSNLELSESLITEQLAVTDEATINDLSATTVSITNLSVSNKMTNTLSCTNIEAEKYLSTNETSSFAIYGNGIKYYKTSAGGYVNNPVDINPVSKKKFASNASYATVKDIIENPKLINIIYDDGTDKSSCVWYISNGIIYLNRNDKTGSTVQISTGGTGGEMIKNYAYIIYEY